MIVNADVVKGLEECLKNGYARFNGSEDLSVYEEAFEFFKRSGLYEGMFRPHIPNPAYDNAAKNMGAEFLAYAAKSGIYFSEHFPGDFSKSTEVEIDGIEARKFHLTAMYSGHEVGHFTLVFPHTHERFAFTAPPTLQFRPRVHVANDVLATEDLISV